MVAGHRPGYCYVRRGELITVPKQLIMYAGHRNESCLLLYIGIESLKIGELQKVGGKEREGLVGGRKGGKEGGRERGKEGGRVSVLGKQAVSCVISPACTFVASKCSQMA